MIVLVRARVRVTVRERARESETRGERRETREKRERERERERGRERERERESEGEGERAVTGFGAAPFGAAGSGDGAAIRQSPASGHHITLCGVWRVSKVQSRNSFNMPNGRRGQYPYRFVDAEGKVRTPSPCHSSDSEETRNNKERFMFWRKFLARKYVRRWRRAVALRKSEINAAEANAPDVLARGFGRDRGIIGAPLMGDG